EAPTIRRYSKDSAELLHKLGAHGRPHILSRCGGLCEVSLFSRQVANPAWTASYPQKTLLYLGEAPGGLQTGIVGRGPQGRGGGHNPGRLVAIHGDDSGFRLHRWSQNRFSAPSVHIRPPMTRPRPPRSRRSWLRAIIGPPRDAPSPSMATISAFDSIGGVKIGFRLHQCTFGRR